MQFVLCKTVVLVVGFNWDCFVVVLSAFVVLGLVSSVLSQEIGWEEYLQNDPFCVEQMWNLNSVKTVKDWTVDRKPVTPE